MPLSLVHVLCMCAYMHLSELQDKFIFDVRWKNQYVLAFMKLVPLLVNLSIIILGDRNYVPIEQLNKISAKLIIKSQNSSLPVY